MNSVVILANYDIGVPPEVTACYNCKYFVQHYTYNPTTNYVSKTYAGHCFYPRIKNRKVFDKCEKFEKKHQ